mgnify:CR=1 FL=1
MRVLDLFSGFGGWSQAFVTAGHEVMRIENNPLLKDVPHTHLMCVKEFRDWIIEQQERGYALVRPDLILASPPCLEFSNAYNAPRAEALRSGIEFKPDMELVEVTLEIIQLLCPKYFIVENVNGSQKFFEAYFGKPKQKIGAYVLYGNFPEIIISGQLPTKESKDKRHSPLRSNYRAEIPLPLSMGALTAILEQTYITDY